MDVRHRPKHSVHALPLDILLEIFAFCLPSSGVPRPSIHTAPLILGRICSHWRRVALSHSPLWSALRIGCDCNPATTENRVDGRQDLIAFREFIQRSRNTPVSLVFRMPGLPPADAEDVLDTLIDEIISVRTRWKAVELHLITANFDRITHALADGAPLLQSLDISGQNIGNPLATLEFDLRRVPRLQHLSLLQGTYSFRLPGSESEGALACCEKLAELDISYHGDCDNLMQTLRHLHRLERLALTLEALLTLRTEIMDIGQYEVLKMECIKSFTLEQESDEDMSIPILVGFLPILKALSLPSLEVLGFDLQISDRIFASMFSRHLFQFIQRSSPPLTKLVLFRNCIDPQTYIETLRLLPTLEQIVVRMDYQADEVVTALTVPPESRHTTLDSAQAQPQLKLLCPNLISFTLTMSTSLRPELIVDMISSRFKDLKPNTTPRPPHSCPTAHPPAISSDSNSLQNTHAVPDSGDLPVPRIRRLEEFYCNVDPPEWIYLSGHPDISRFVQQGLAFGTQNPVEAYSSA